MVTIPYDKIDQLSVKTWFKVIKCLDGITEKFNYTIEILKYEIFRECKNGNLYIANIATVKEARGLGVGKILMSHAEKEAKRNNFAGISLIAKDENVTKFYEKLDYDTTFDKMVLGERYIKMVKMV
jgi:ribosomal protein S18 acetylase RimI-like enzyme